MPPSKKKAASGSNPARSIVLRGAREHNLRNIDVEIPHNTLSVVTGVSGSGKSTLAFDILFSEGQRRFLECMSAYARQFVEQLPKPEMDFLGGLPPTVAIEQRVTRGGTKSTVATITEIAQYLRLLYAKIGVAHNPATGNVIANVAPAVLRERLRKSVARHSTGGRRVLLCAPLIHDRKGHYQPLAAWARKHGYAMLRIDGRLVPLDDFKPLDRYKTHDIELVMNSADAFDDALRLGKGACVLVEAASGKAIEWLSTERTDPETGESFPPLEPKQFSWNSPKGWCPACHGHGREVAKFAEVEEGRLNEEAGADKLGDAVCPVCAGARLNPYGCAVTLSLRANAGMPAGITLHALLALAPQDAVAALSQLELDTRGRAVAGVVLPEILARLQFLDRVGLGYLALDRATETLSGGEAQRIRLAAQLGSNLSGALYVLDEPSIGLHPRDNDRLIASLRDLRDRGNTVLVVEHDEETMRAADLVYDLGPGAGASGGKLLAAGSVADVKKNAESLTARYLRDAIKHPLRGAWRDVSGVSAKKTPKRDAAGSLVVSGACLRNLKGVDAVFAVGRLNVVCGVSGAGKSTLVRDLLAPAASFAIKRGGDKVTSAQLVAGGVFPAGIPLVRELRGLGRFKQSIVVEQDPIGKTPRSTPATYIGAFDKIREYFAALPESKMRGHNASFFSFNTSGGRCETCGGAGRVKLEMNFLPDSYVPCEDCGGCRYGASAREVRWRGKDIGEVLAMSFEEAVEFFSFDKSLHALLSLMVETGLGYLTLGQSSPTLSGGEAQRVKLVSELAKGLDGRGKPGAGTKAERKSNLYILEEPTIGLHQADCERLIGLLHRLVEHGHTVVVIEHHLDVIAEADWVLELGPEGGNAGGQLLYQGPVSGLATADTPTAPFLRGVLNGA